MSILARNLILHYIKYARIRVFTDPYFPYKDRIYGKIRVGEKPYSRIFYAVLEKVVKVTIKQNEQKLKLIISTKFIVNIQILIFISQRI